jgi:Tol biopolymer transport system component
LAIDIAGNPVISYQDVTASDLKVAHCLNPTCNPNIKTNTPASPNPVEIPLGNIKVTFPRVNSGGNTTVVPSGTCASSTPDWYKLNLGANPCYDISSTAGYKTPVEVCIHYDDTGLTLVQEFQLRILHYETTPPPPGMKEKPRTFLDIGADIICTQVTSLSPFVVAELLPPKIALTSDRDGNAEIYAMNDDGSSQTRLTNNSANDYQPAWSADGSQIAFFTNRDAGDYEVYKMDADGANPVRLTTSGGDDGGPAWSPNGAKIAFHSARDGTFEIYSMNADGSSQTRLTPLANGGFEADAEWSPDGTKIVFWSDTDGDSDIYTMNADGSGRTQLTFNGASDTHPVWSPDGTKIAFRSTRDGNDEVYTMNANGSGQTNLSLWPSSEQEPTWSADGTKIAFHTDRDGNLEIYRTASDGSSGDTLLSGNPSADYGANWKRGAGPGADSDLDGCMDAKEALPQASLGGLRNPQHFWDYYDVWTLSGMTWVRDKTINIPGDILGVAKRFGAGPLPPAKGQAVIDALTPPTSATGYHIDYDRGMTLGPNGWNKAGPDGTINIPNDILGVAGQFGHSCA